MLEKECAEHPINAQGDNHNAETAGLKKCPFCAEHIQPEAIKCRYCGEFLYGHSRAETKRPLGKWNFSIGVTVIALLCLGPIALPMVWMNRRYKPATKVIISIVVVIVTIMCIYLAINTYRQLYEQLDILGM